MTAGRRYVWIPVAAFAAGVMVVGVQVVTGGELTVGLGTDAQGPAFSKTGYFATMYHGEPGESLSLGHLELRNDSPNVVQIESVAPVFADPAPELLGVVIAGPDRMYRASWDRIEGFPPADTDFYPEVFEVAGYEVEPSPEPADYGALVLIGVRVPDDLELVRLERIEVTYRINDLRVREYFQYQVQICPEQVVDAGDCSLPDRDPDD